MTRMPCGKYSWSLGLACRAQETVLGGSFQGVPLQGATFDEPGSGEAPAHRGINQRELRWARCAARRDARFEAVYDAIDRLILWAKLERHEFMARGAPFGCTTSSPATNSNRLV